MKIKSNMGIQSAFVNTSIFDSSYFDALFGGAIFPDGVFMIDHKDGILLFQKWFLEEMRDIKDRGNVFTFPVNTISLLKKDGKFEDEEFAKWVCEHNRKWNDSNFFVDDSVTSLSNCCRLKSNIAQLGFFDSTNKSSQENTSTALKEMQEKEKLVFAETNKELQNMYKEYLKKQGQGNV